VANWTRGSTQEEEQEQAALLSNETRLWEDDYDLAYNYATWLLLFQKSKEALAMLEQAETTCRHSNEDGDEDVEMDVELSPILLHQAMCHFGLSNNKENNDMAKKLYLGQALLKSSSPQCVAVAKANLAVCSKNTMAQVTLAHLDLPPPLDTTTTTNAFQHSPYTPVQQRHVLYNRALVYLAQASSSNRTKAAGAAKACRAALADLQSRLLGVSHPKKNHSAVAPATDDIAAQIWINRIAMVESELLRVVEHNPKAAYQLLTTCLEQTSTKSSSSASFEKKEAWNMVRAELLLYRHVQQQQSQQPPQQNDNDNDDDDNDSKAPIPVTKEDTIALLECAQDIPQRPGTLATIASLYRELGDVERATAVLQSSIMKDNHPLALAHSKYEAGLYQEAADLYESCLNSCRDDASSNDTDDAAAQDVGLVTAHLIQALSHVDPDRALSYTLPEAHPTMEDGAALEALEIPRLSGSTTTTTTMNGMGGSNKALTKTSKKEAVMEKRAKRREAHVKSLPPAEQERTPDPERWIPKAQRSHHKNRRGRKGRFQSNLNATTTTQGGGSGAGADRNAAKLDVAARKKDGGTSTTGPSTANMSVTPSAAGTKRKGKGRR
jgi:tetratricopeptide (TPR) repeat protein